MIFAFSRLETVILIAATSYFLTLISLPIPKKIGLKLKLFDKPSSRKQPKKNLVRIGGISLVVGFAISTFLINLITDFSLFSNDITLNIVIASIIIFLIGLCDDLYNISPFIRLILQVFISIILWSKGLRIEKIDIVWLQISEIYFSNLFSVIFTSIWIVGITNAINWLDGLDGLASGIVGFASLGLSTITFQNGQIIEPMLGAAVLGSSFGFLRYNFFPAKILMGDGGSNFLGFLLATISLKSISSNVNPIGLFVPLLLLGLPILDMAYVIYRRLRKRKSPFIADREHIHHRLMNSGLTEIGTVLNLYGISQWITVLTITLASLNNSFYLIFFMFSSILLFLSSFLTKFINF
ncbi:MraY family glycosyltransferase [Prochlorococcus marinus]|uniref:Undecaprenyl-phosphate N-acetylglucosaminyl 1-phosphate transferase n=1 Tax=Prochlorococcus marinus (strain AS9601) TaxID=146891 RepID=A2BSB9_PROMS|nr:MraY family glycosyltransferase [Prochlorococcus marinus]ABM70680.1 Hypothetical protein A9601_13961 [Prochlorococcus marinus str. AS9601]